MGSITKTKEWIASFVIKHNLCPFAKFPHENQLIHYYLAKGEMLEELLKEAFEQIMELDQQSPKARSTSFFIIEAHSFTFDQLLLLIELLEELLKTAEIQDQYQLVAFHPEFQFKDKDRTSLSNRVNQSPHAMVHILRSSQVEQARQSEYSAAKITMQNDITLRGLGQKEN